MGKQANSIALNSGQIGMHVSRTEVLQVYLETLEDTSHETLEDQLVLLGPNVGRWTCSWDQINSEMLHVT